MNGLLLWGNVKLVLTQLPALLDVKVSYVLEKWPEQGICNADRFASRIIDREAGEKVTGDALQGSGGNESRLGELAEPRLYRVVVSFATPTFVTETLHERVQLEAHSSPGLAPPAANMISSGNVRARTTIGTSDRTSLPGRVDS